MGKRVTRNAVGTALKDDEFRCGLFNERLHFEPGGVECLIAGIGWHGDIEFAPFGRPFAGLASAACAGVEVTAIFMQVGKDQVWVLFKGVEDAIAVVGINIDIGHSLNTMSGAQGFNCDATVIEDAEPGGRVAAGMVQPRNGHEGASAVVLDDLVDGIQHAAYHIGGGLVGVWKTGGVATIQIAATCLRHGFDFSHIIGGVEQLNGCLICPLWRADLNLMMQASFGKFPPKGVESISAKRVGVAEAVAGNLFACVNTNGWLGAHSGCSCQISLPTLLFKRGATQQMQDGWVIILGNMQKMNHKLKHSVQCRRVTALWSFILLMVAMCAFADGVASQQDRVWVPGWRDGPLMQTPRSGAAVVEVDGVIHLIGGVDGKNFLRSSEFIRVSTESGLSEWSQGSALNTPRGFFSAVRHKNFVYAVGGGQGRYGKTLLDSIERAEIQPDGTLGTWTIERFKLNTKRRCTKVAVIGGYLYAFGGFGGTLLDSVERAEIQPDGTLGEWAVLTDSMNMARYIHDVSKVHNRIYMIGGHDKVRGVGITDVEWSQEDEEGWLVPWQPSEPLQTGRYGLATIQHGDHLYALGGLDGAAYLDSVEKAKISPDGSLSSWRYTTPLASRREGMNVAVVNGTLYVMGGTNLTGYQRSIEYASFNAQGDIGYWATAAEAAVKKRELDKKAAQRKILPNEAVVIAHLKAALYSYLEVQRSDGMSAWLAGPTADIPIGTRIQFPNGVVMRNFYSKELKRNFPVLMFVGELRMLKQPESKQIIYRKQE